MENTSDFIIETIAPIFNKKGYVGTSLSDMTKATKLTKGALYCNFKNKEELAVKSFQLNIQKALGPLFVQISEQSTSLEKLEVLTNYFRNYYDLVKLRGGCPVLNVGIDAKHNNPALFEETKKAASRLMKGLARIIQFGIDSSEIKQSVDPAKYARIIYAMIEGAVFMSLLYEDRSYLSEVVDSIDDIITTQLKRE